MRCGFCNHRNRCELSEMESARAGCGNEGVQGRIEVKLGLFLKAVDSWIGWGCGDYERRRWINGDGDARGRMSCLL